MGFHVGAAGLVAVSRDGDTMMSRGISTVLVLMVAVAVADAAPDAPPQPAPTTVPAPAATPAPTTAAPAPTPPAPKHESDEEEGEPKLSLPTEADRAAWRRPGFRLGLGFLYGELAGLRGAPSGRLLGPLVRVGLRLDDDWSITTSFQYLQASRSGGLSALRFAGTIDPTWHVTRQLSLALGVGFGGIVEGNTGRDDPAPDPETLESSYTFPDARMPLASCNGVGIAGLTRAEYAYVVGPRSQLSVALELVGQWTGCIDDSGRVEPDTGDAIVRRQWWPHAGVSFAIGITFR